MKVIIAGTRSFNDYNLLKVKCDRILSNTGYVEIVSGGAPGVDSLAERYAKERGYKFTLFPADWDTHGKKAGPIRNEQMAKYADSLIAFWDGESLGTLSMIAFAVNHKLNIRVIRPC